MFYLSSQWGVLQKYLGSSDSSLFQTTGILSFLLLREKILKKSYFLISVLVVLGLCCYMQAFSSCGERGLLFVAVCRLLIAMASLAMEHRL